MKSVLKTAILMLATSLMVGLQANSASQSLPVNQVQCHYIDDNGIAFNMSADLRPRHASINITNVNDFNPLTFDLHEVVVTSLTIGKIIGGSSAGHAYSLIVPHNVLLVPGQEIAAQFESVIAIKNNNQTTIKSFVADCIGTLKQDVEHRSIKVLSASYIQNMMPVIGTGVRKPYMIINIEAPVLPTGAAYVARVVKMADRQILQVFERASPIEIDFESEQREESSVHVDINEYNPNSPLYYLENVLKVEKMVVH